MTNKAQNPNIKKQYDLKERTAKFGENIIDFVISLDSTPITRPLVSQLVRAGTSIGANYAEADGATSQKDFLHKISLCKKESKETIHWLRMITKVANRKEQCILLSKEAQELSLIFSAIFNKVKLKSKN